MKFEITMTKKIQTQTFCICIYLQGNFCTISYHMYTEHRRIKELITQ